MSERAAIHRLQIHFARAGKPVSRGGPTTDVTALSDPSTGALPSRVSRALPHGLRSRIPGRIVHSLRTDTLNFLTRTARRYGDFVPFRVGPWLYVLVNDPDAIREVLVTDADRYVKGPALRRGEETLGGGGGPRGGGGHRPPRRG